MPKYLWLSSYTSQGTQGLLKDGGSGRRKAIERLAQEMGGKLESFYFAFGKTDVVAIVDLPDAATAAAISLAVNATGTAEVYTTPLLTVEEMDAASKKTVHYSAPGAAGR